MHKAIQELKTRTKVVLLVSFLLLAAAIGLYGLYQNDRTTSSGSEESVVQNQIQKQPVTTLPMQKATVLESRKQYVVQAGDSYWIITNKMKPNNVEPLEYMAVLKKVNNNVQLHTAVPIYVPNDNDLMHVTLPDVVVKFDVYDDIVVNHIKEAEGSKEAQSNNKRRLLGGKVGPSFSKNRFYPYKDTKGNYTIGYGHYIGPKESEARKYRFGLTEREAHKLLIQDMKKTREDFILLLKRKNAVNLSVEQQRVLYEMAFNMGVDKLSTFGKLWKSVERQNEKKFKKEIENSLWYRQVGNRAEMLLSSL
ncbi:hypothetical protein EJP02_183 [Escherichia phage EJP2]|nr:hypothetical protein EJP02_183 [Escherichia phage EJP2]